MSAKLRLILLLSIPLTILIVSFFVDDKEINMKGRFLSPLGSLYKIELHKDQLEAASLSKTEKKFIKKKFRRKSEILLNSEQIDKKSGTINTLIDKGVIHKEHYSYHLFGTDNMGRDLLEMLTLATKHNLSLSIIAVLVSISMGTFLGILQGYILNRDTSPYYLKIRKAISFIIDSITSIPMLVWMLIIVLFNELILDIQDDFLKTMWTFIFMGIFYYSSILSQAIEEHIQSIKELEFLASSELMGLSKIKIIYHHIIRTNLGDLLFSQSLMIIIQTIMLEITISFGYIDFGLSHVVSYGTLANQMFQNPQSVNMMIPIIFAGILCGLLNWINSAYKAVKA